MEKRLLRLQNHQQKIISDIVSFRLLTWFFFNSLSPESQRYVFSIGITEVWPEFVLVTLFQFDQIEKVS